MPSSSSWECGVVAAKLRSFPAADGSQLRGHGQRLSSCRARNRPPRPRNAADILERIIKPTGPQAPCDPVMPWHRNIDGGVPASSCNTAAVFDDNSPKSLFSKAEPVAPRSPNHSGHRFPTVCLVRRCCLQTWLWPPTPHSLHLHQSRHHAAREEFHHVSELRVAAGAQGRGSPWQVWDSLLSDSTQPLWKEHHLTGGLVLAILGPHV